MATHLDWQTDGADWPNRQRSRFVDAGGLRWHLQHWPRPGAPVLLLLHGAGASTHSFAQLAPLLAEEVELVVPDLPGHGFSGPAPAGAAGMVGMAHSTAALLRELGRDVDIVVGHSAGAAVAVSMAMKTAAVPRVLVGINAALLPLRGLAGTFFSPAAKLLALNPLVPRLFAWRAADRIVLDRLLASTGSSVDAAARALYGRLIANPGHVAGTLAMMARWDLPALAAELPQLKLPLHLLVGARDGTIPPADAARVQALLPGTTRQMLPGLGHLAHEERPRELAERVLQLVARGRVRV